MNTAAVDGVAATRAALRANRAALIDAFRAHPQRVSPLLRGLCRATDATLRTLWHDCGMPPDCALLAVGGYGRG